MTTELDACSPSVTAAARSTSRSPTAPAGSAAAVRLPQPRRHRRRRRRRGDARTSRRVLAGLRRRSTDGRRGAACTRCTARDVVRGRCGGAAGPLPHGTDGLPEADALVTDAPGRGAGGPGGRLRAGAPRRPRGRRGRGAARGRPGLVAGVVPPASPRCAGSAPTGVDPAWVGPHVCGRCYEVPGGDARRGRRRSSRGLAAETSWGTPALDLGAGVRAQLRGRGRRGRGRARAAPSRTTDLYSYRRDGAASGRLAGLVRVPAVSDAGRDPRRAARPRSPTALATVAARIAGRLRRRRARRRRGDPRRGDQVLPGLRRPAARRARGPPRGREPAPGGRRPSARSAPTSTSRWHFVGGLQSNKAAAVGALGRRGAVGRPGEAAARPGAGARTSATRGPLDVLVQVSLDPTPRRRGARGGAAPEDVAGPGRAVAGRRRAPAAAA